MKKINFITSFIFLFFIIGCEKEYNTLGGESLLFQSFTEGYTKVPVFSFQEKISRVETSNLPLLQLGKYSNETFGSVDASIVSQFSLTIPKPRFGEIIHSEEMTDTTMENEVIKKVYLEIPFFSNITSTEDDGENIYKIDSLFGQRNSKFKIKVYELDYNLRNLDPNDNFESNQPYYSNEDFVNTHIGDLLGESSESIEIYETAFDQIDSSKDTIPIRLSPRIRMTLDNDFFQKNILDKEGETVFDNNDEFRKHLKGLYIKTEFSEEDKPLLMLLDFYNAVIKIEYEYTKFLDEGTEQRNGFYNFGLGGISFNLFNTTEPTSAIPLNSSDKIYLKGGLGYSSKIKLFDALSGSYLDSLKQKTSNWIIQEASLKFHIDTTFNVANIPQKIYLYKTSGSDNKIIDFSINSAIFSGFLDSDNNYYKFRLTEHLTNILKRDSTNVDLRLLVNTSALSNNIVNKSAYIEGSTSEITVPAGSIINSPFESVLVGSNPTDSNLLDKKIELEIFYVNYSN